MPLVQYFSYVGAILLAVMLAVGHYLPPRPAGSESIRYDIRVKADHGGQKTAGPTTFADFSGTLQQRPASTDAVSPTVRDAMAKAPEASHQTVRVVRNTSRIARTTSSRPASLRTAAAPPPHPVQSPRRMAAVPVAIDTEMGAGWR
ncbi:hypothetical protein X566_02280 [Afipia sp. P52-10]|uniref:hypothetical protein n=1 Tax=Afipia sp. P52-10 TaxID=1429916 RepID=UPI0003DF1963|nr:hypothetical protein [Afipia sp. P52-10]ETR78912.1 hypothetical protein X566_02280 [Afipia sp. P52-10]